MSLPALMPQVLEHLQAAVGLIPGWHQARTHGNNLRATLDFCLGRRRRSGHHRRSNQHRSPLRQLPSRHPGYLLMMSCQMPLMAAGPIRTPPPHLCGDEEQRRATRSLTGSLLTS